MKVELEKSFPMPASAETTWAFLQDIEAVAGCMPGAKITERLDASRYKGTVTVKVGPATMSFRGEVEVRDIDPPSRSLRLLGKGTDSTGTSGAAMDLKARIEGGDANASTLVGKSEVSMSGKAATFGGRMMGAIADQILKQFADNFAKRVGALAPERAAAEAVAPPAVAQPAAEPAEATAAPAVAPVPVPTSARASPSAAPVSNELNGLALMWAVVKDRLRSIFSRKAA